VENLTHTLVGAAVGEAACPPRAHRAERRLFAVAGTIAANLPDIDLVYTGITDPPLGYLLHHRGHTHTFAGAAVLTIALAGGLGLFPMVRRLTSGVRARLWTVAAAGLLTHLLLDWANSYGVHPFYPLDNRWYYGDTFFILEPMLWVALALPLGLNVRGWWRAALMSVGLVLPSLAAAIGLVPWSSSAALAAGGALLLWRLGRQPPFMRALVGLGLVAAIAASMSGLSRAVQSRVLSTMPAVTVHDVILTPNPSSPSCWAVIVVASDPDGTTLTMRQGSFSFMPGWIPPERCALHRTLGGGTTGDRVNAQLVWSDEITERREAFAALRRRDCRAAAWLRFGRAPVLADGRIFDLRFSSRLGANFSSMTLDRAPGECPEFVPPWGLPRADVIDADRP
jgi:inner membrane protein